MPVGIVEIHGKFDAGDAVDILEIDPTSGALTGLGKGICNYSAQELSRVRGMNSKAIQDILPRATEEAIHRDYLVLD
ncbi:MAG: PUA domain-containing protein [Solirubrobacteraceae bacterium]